MTSTIILRVQNQDSSVNINKGFIGKSKVYEKVTDYSGNIDLAVIVIPANLFRKH